MRGSFMSKLGIVIAMEVEAQELINHFKFEKLDSEENIYVSSNVRKFEKIYICISGIGMENSSMATQYLILKYGVDLIVNVGYAGSNILKIGEIVSPSSVFNIDFDLTIMGYKRYEIPKTDDITINQISKYTDATCYSANHFVTKSSETNAAVYDMELHGVAMACKKYKIQVYSIKIVTDSLDEKVYNQNESEITFSKKLLNALIYCIEKDIF
jgi:nucleoside phosphorylase